VALVLRATQVPLYWGGGFVVAVFSPVRMSQRREWGLLTAPGAGRDLGWGLPAAVLVVAAQVF
jgi:hypothetical protein